MMDLIERLERAETGSQELDAAICIAIGYAGQNGEGAANIRTDPDWEGDLLFEIGAEECCNPIPNLTTSLDAIVALIGQKMPGWTWDAGDRFYGSDWDLAWARVYPHRQQGAGTGNVTAKTPPTALCVALLRAIQSKETSNGG